MSADNFVAVYPNGDDEWQVSDGSMSVLMEDCQYRGTLIAYYTTREAALVAALNYAQTLPVLEYGVIEEKPIPEEFCGRCFVCVHERGVIDKQNLQKCDGCGEFLSTSEWAVMTQAGTFHSRCEPGR